MVHWQWPSNRSVPPRSRLFSTVALLLFLSATSSAQVPERRFGFEVDGFSFLFPEEKLGTYRALSQDPLNASDLASFDEFMQAVHAQTGVRIEISPHVQAAHRNQFRGAFPAAFARLTPLAWLESVVHSEERDAPRCDFVCLPGRRVRIDLASHLTMVGHGKTKSERVLCRMNSIYDPGRLVWPKDIARCRAALSTALPGIPPEGTFSDHASYFLENCKIAMLYDDPAAAEILAEKVETKLRIAGKPANWGEYLDRLLGPIGLSYYYVTYFVVVMPGDARALQQEVNEIDQEIRSLLHRSVHIGPGRVTLQQAVDQVRRQAKIALFVEPEMWAANLGEYTEADGETVESVMNRLAAGTRGNWELFEDGIYLYRHPLRRGE